MAYSEAQKRATAKYMKATLDNIMIRVPKGKREQYKEFAKAKGTSLTKMVIELIENEINNN